MSVHRSGVTHAQLFVVSIAMGGTLIAQSAGQTTQPSGTETTASSAALPGERSGPPGKVMGQDGPASPDAFARVKDAALERLGPGGTAAKATNQQRGPRGTFDPAQIPTPGPRAPAGMASPTARPDEQQPATKPGARRDGGRVADEPVARNGLLVFIDPATGQITAPTDSQLQELNRQNPSANLAFEQTEVVERPALGGGVVADVPASLFPVMTASIGAGGKVTLEERQNQTTANGRAGNQHISAELPPAADVTVTIVNVDGAGEGFNDPTPVAPVFGNPGTTLGAQRLNVFRAAAEYWGAILKSPVPIQVNAKMDPQFCSGASAVLGSAGATTVHRDFTGAPLAGTWYVQATANSRAGTDLDPAQSDISATFNSDIDNATCLGSTNWWYGIGGPVPNKDLDFYTVVLHEIGHGIGVLSLVNLTTGAKFGGLDDAYERWLWDFGGGGWPGMTNAQRVASAVNTGQVVFWGPQATAAARGLLSAGLNTGYPRVFAPNPVQGGSSISHFDTVLIPNELMEPYSTPPPGPYAYITSGLLEDIGWRLLANGVFDFGSSGTWAWNHTDGWLQISGADPTNLEPWNGNVVGNYGATWLWNGTTQEWTQISTSEPDHLKACGNNMLWASAAFGTWRYNLSSGWAQLTTVSPDSLECFGGDAVWEGNAGTWLFNFGTDAWSQITAADGTGVLPCGSRLVWWRTGAGGDAWYYDAASGWHYVSVNPETTACYQGRLAWGGMAGTWLFNFPASSWTNISSANPEQMLTVGPNLFWESTQFGTWVWDGTAWTQISTANPTVMESLGTQLLGSFPAGIWVWSGGGSTGWTNISSALAAEIVTTGAVK